MHLAGAVGVPDDVGQRYADAGLWDGAPLREGLEAWASRAPRRPAVADAGTSRTYAELEAAVAAGVGALRAHDIGAGAAVLVVAPLTAPAVAAYHAVIRTGAVVVMLDRRCGRADVTHALDVLDVRLVLSDDDLAGRLALTESTVPFLSFDALVSSAEPVRTWAEPDPRTPAAVVFTSGTTSRPKGVVHSLDTLRAGARAMADVLQLDESDVAFLSTPLASITGLVQVHLTLDRGAGLVLEDDFDRARSLDRLRAHGATVLGGAPVILEELFKEAAAQQLQDLPLHSIALGGAMIPRPVLEIAVDRYGIEPVRMYGSSEIPCATGTRPADEGAARLADDGAASPGVELRTDGDIAGELLVRGPMRFLGYLDADDNIGAFAPGGWYRTGDLGVVHDGRLTVTGRLKEVVARKGLKISLAEVDDAARRLPGVEEVAAYGVPDPETGERLVLAVHVRDPDALDFDDIVGRLLDGGLAKWKLPEQVVVWTTPLPRTESGKIQRRRLAEDEQPRPVLLAPRLKAGS